MDHSSGGTNHCCLYTVTKLRTASATLHGRPSMKITPGIPGQENADAIAGRGDRSLSMGIQQRASWKMRASSWPCYTV